MRRFWATVTALLATSVLCAVALLGYQHLGRVLLMLLGLASLGVAVFALAGHISIRRRQRKERARNGIHRNHS